MYVNTSCISPIISIHTTLFIVTLSVPRKSQLVTVMNFSIDAEGRKDLALYFCLQYSCRRDLIDHPAETVIGTVV